MRSTMAQGRLLGVALLCRPIELDLTKTIDSVASKKDRKKHRMQYKQVVSTKLNLYCVKTVLL